MRNTVETGKRSSPSACSLMSMKRAYLAEIGAACVRASKSKSSALIGATIDVLRSAPAQLARLEDLTTEPSSGGAQ
jgi:hypothetical protein